MGTDDKGYFTLRDILGHNAKWNLVLSDRGRGKTYTTKSFLWNQPDEFMCVYRQKPDMVSSVDSWLDTLREQGARTDSITWDGSDSAGYQLMDDGEIRGYFRSISAVNRIKQEKFPDTLNWMWWDEFIPLAWTKLPGIDSEGDALRTIYRTIDHDSAHSRESKGLKPLRVLMYGNPRTWDNPILSYFHVDPLKGVGIHRVSKDIVYEILPPLERTDGVSATLGDEVDRNMAFLDQGSFCSPIPKGSAPAASFRLGTEFYVLYQSQDGRYWMKRAKQHAGIVSRRSGMRICYGTLEGLREEERCLEDTAYPQRLRTMMYRGQLRFEDMNTKFDFMRAMSDL